MSGEIEISLEEERRRLRAASQARPATAPGPAPEEPKPAVDNGQAADAVTQDAAPDGEPKPVDKLAWGYYRGRSG